MSKFPCGVRRSTIVPGTLSLSAADSTTAWNALGSMVFSAAGFAALVAVVVVIVVAGEELVGSAVDEQLASSKVTHAASPAMRTGVSITTTASPMGRV
jgi:hypothetical protein